MFVTFLSDYGERDPFVGVCHGVIARRAPAARIIDITHGIARQDVRAGAIALTDALPHMPAGVHLAVVDPGVGGSRRAVALRCAREERLLVGPDNGLLMLAAERFGGAVEAVEIGRSRWRLEPVSATFHGRDVFAPVAAALARGEALAGAGEALAVAELVALELPAPRVAGGELIAHALTADGFGNVVLDAGLDDLAAAGLRPGATLEVRTGPGVTRSARFGTTFADVAPGALLLYEDAQCRLALAVNQGSARDELGLARDAELRLRPGGGGG